MIIKALLYNIDNKPWPQSKVLCERNGDNKSACYGLVANPKSIT